MSEQTATSFRDLQPIDWLHTDSDDGGTYYTACDFCFESAMHDVWKHDDPADYRKFFRCKDALCVCEKCVGEYLLGERSGDAI